MKTKLISFHQSQQVPGFRFCAITSFAPVLCIVMPRKDYHARTWVTDKQGGGGSYLGLIWRRCPCPAGFCGDTEGKAVINTVAFVRNKTKLSHGYTE